MSKKFSSTLVVIGTFLAFAVSAYAISQLFFSSTKSSSLSTKTIFQFDLSTGMTAGELGPGDSFTVTPNIYNDATEPMYVFIVVDQPTCSMGNLYTYEVSDGWTLLSDSNGRQIYGYGTDEMTTFLPGETTENLTEKMTMQEISNAEFSRYEDINVTITAYGIGTEDVPTDLEGAWGACKLAGQLS